MFGFGAVFGSYDCIARTRDVLAGYGTAKTRSVLLTTIAEAQARITKDHRSILDNEVDIRTQTSKKKSRKSKLETMQEEDERVITDQL